MTDEQRIAAAAEAIRRVGMDPAWWVDSVGKLRLRWPSLPADVFIEALLAVGRECPEGKRWPIARAWRFLEGCVRRSATQREEEAERHAAITTVDDDATDRSLAAFMADVEGGADL